MRENQHHPCPAWTRWSFDFRLHRLFWLRVFLRILPEHLRHAADESHGISSCCEHELHGSQRFSNGLHCQPMQA